MVIAGKIAFGAVVTAAMTMIAYGPLGFGQRSIGHLQRRGEEALAAAGVTDVHVAFVEQPALRRVAVLSGKDRRSSARKNALAIVARVPGIADVRWQPEPGTGEPYIAW